MALDSCEVHNDAVLACYSTVHCVGSLSDIVLPWLLLCLMRTPAHDTAEHERITARVLLLLQCGRRDAPAPAACSTSMMCRVSRACIARVALLEATVKSMCVEKRLQSAVVSKRVRAVGGDQVRIRRVISRRGLSGKRSLARGC